MRLLLDTHVLLWWLQDNPRLGSKARAMIADPDNDVAVSIASPWEIAAKHRIGKLHVSGATTLANLQDSEIAVIALTADHLAALESLPNHHRDPFDHLIVAQAHVEGMTVITDDVILPRYGVPCIGVA